jgi:hypothetical protein
MTDNRMNEHETRSTSDPASFDRSILVDLAYGRIPPEESQRLLDIIAADEGLSNELELVILLLNEGGRRPEEQKVAYPPGVPTSRRLREASSLAPTLLRVAAVILLCLGVGWYADTVTSPPFVAAASVTPADLHIRMRSGGADIVSGSRLYLHNGDWRECVRRLDWYIAVYPEGRDIASASTLKGAAYLMGARSHILGLYVRYDKALVDSALASLKQARSRIPLAELEDDIDWFEAKAMLMKGDPPAATALLQRIVGRTGARTGDAFKLLQEMRMSQR